MSELEPVTEETPELTPVEELTDTLHRRIERFVAPMVVLVVILDR